MNDDHKMALILVTTILLIAALIGFGVIRLQDNLAAQQMKCMDLKGEWLRQEEKCLFIR